MLLRIVRLAGRLYALIEKSQLVPRKFTQQLDSTLVAHKKHQTIFQRQPRSVFSYQPEWLINMLKRLYKVTVQPFKSLHFSRPTLPTFHWPKVSLPSFSLQLPKPAKRQHPPSREPPVFHPLFRYGLSLILTSTILASGYFTYTYILKDLPSVRNLSEREQIVTTKILDRHGTVLYSIYEDENRTLIPLSEVPPHMIQATIAIEDKSFYSHHGFAPRAILRALLANIKNETIEEGGSTITQQLVKNTLLSPEQTIQRKIKEVILSVLVDSMYTKEEILQMYFNQIAYGGSTYGIEEAAQRYFGKHARDLTVAESALLAGLPAAPSVYSPFGPHPELAYTRQAEVLRRMVEDGYLSAEDASAAKREVLTFKSDNTDINAPHFVMYIRSLLAERYGEQLVSQGGLVVKTTLDLEVQEMAEAAVQEEVARLARLHVSNGAALVTNPKTGEILAMVGSVDYFDFNHGGQVNVTLRPRQPGSSIKPLVYATAFQQRMLSPSSIIDDSKVTYQTLGSPPYTPVNYDGRFHGKVTARESLASSYNIPAVKTLALIGVNSFIDQAETMGISTWKDRRRFGLSLALGGGEVLMTDMAEAYSSFANYGYSVPLNPIVEVSNYKGDVLYKNSCLKDDANCPQLSSIDPRVAYQITDILKDNQARSPAFGTQSVLHIPGQEVAVKTGTTNSLRDNWTIGYTKDRLVAVWVGNNDNTPMSSVASGITGASPIWNDIMRNLLDKDNPHAFTEPTGLLKVAICKPTGTLPCTGCPLVVDEYFVPGSEPTTTCNYTRPEPTASPVPQIR